MTAIQPKKPAAASRKPSLAPVFVASSRYTLPGRITNAVTTMSAPRICGSQASAASRCDVTSEPSLVLDDGVDLFLGQDAAEARHAAALVAALSTRAVRLSVLRARGDELVHQRLVGEL